jgi:membrane protease YdiL (CAAX protease family)
MEVWSVKRHPLLSFFAIAFALSWGLGAIFFIFSAQFIQIFGEPDLSKPFYNIYNHLATAGIPVAAFVVVWRLHGTAGVRSCLCRFLHWRVGIRWYLLAVALLPVLYACSRMIYVALGEDAGAYYFSPWYLAIPSALFQLINDAGPMEEFGWRGFALPLLQGKFTAFWASIILGLIWAVWHIPAFYIPGTAQSAWDLPTFFLNMVSLSIIMTALYNATGGSILLAFLFHWQINNPFHLSAFPNDRLIFTLLFAAAAVVMTVILGPKRLGAVKHTEVVPQSTNRAAGTFSFHKPPPF